MVLIYSLCADFLGCGTLACMVLVQPAGGDTDMLVKFRFFYANVAVNLFQFLEGGLDDNNNFHQVEIKDTANFTEAFRKAVVKLFVKNELLNIEFARQFLNWKNSGFSGRNSKDYCLF